MSLDRDAIRARAEAATPGTWQESKAGDWRVGYFERGAWNTIARIVTWEGGGPDARFLANARQDVPALLDALDKLAAEVWSGSRRCAWCTNRLRQGDDCRCTPCTAALALLSELGYELGEVGEGGRASR